MQSLASYFMYAKAMSHNKKGKTLGQTSRFLAAGLGIKILKKTEIQLENRNPN